MSTCNPNTLLADGKCFYGIGPKEAQAIRLQLLCEILSRTGGAAADISALQAAIAALQAGPTVLDLVYAASMNIDFDAADYQTIALTGDIDLTASLNRPATGFAKSVAVVLVGDGSDRALTYNANWTAIGAAPTQVSAGKIGVVSLTAIGPAEGDVLIVYQEQP